MLHCQISTAQARLQDAIVELAALLVVSILKTEDTMSASCLQKTHFMQKNIRTMSRADSKTALQCSVCYAQEKARQ